MMDGIVMLVNEFPPINVGGAERQAERLSAYLAQRGWNVLVLTRRAENLPFHETRSGFQINRIRQFGPGKVRTFTFTLGALVKLWQLRAHYRILHAHLAFGPAFVAVVAGHLSGKSVLVKLGNSGEFGDIRVSQHTLRGWLRLAAFRRWADGIIVLDETMHNEAIAAGFDPQRLYRMNNGIDATAFAPPRSRQSAQEKLGLAGKVIVLYVGRLALQKSLPTLLAGFAQARPYCPALHLLLVGDGPERSALEALAQKLGITEQVTFAGNQADVNPYLEAAELFALPSTAEGISNALLEAMAAGLACLATPVGGNREVLDNGQVGLLLPPEDVDAWGQALADLGNDSERRAYLGDAARRRILSHYDFSVVGGQYEKLYARLCHVTSIVAADQDQLAQ